jgi:hypothetical protein
MDIHSIRRRRLRELIDARFEGNNAKFAASMEWAPAIVGRFFTRTRNGRRITERSARAIESKCYLEKHWLDEPSNIPLSVQRPLPVYKIPQKVQDKLLELFDGLTDVQQEEIIDQIEAYQKANQAVLKQLGGRNRTVSKTRAAERLPAAPKENA